MRFVLYNIRYGAGTGPFFHLPLPFLGYLRKTNGNLEQIKNFIQELDPDIVGLIEVDAGSYRTAKRHQAADIAEALKHRHVFENKYAVSSLARKVPILSKQGNALLTNQPIAAKRFHYFDAGVKRLVIEIEMAKLTVLLVHLSLKYRQRQRQLADLYLLLRSIQKPVILAGDFNVLHGGHELALFLAATRLQSVNAGEWPSHPSRSPSRQLDYILYSKGIVPRAFYLPQIRYSDHIPLVYDFDVTDAKPARPAPTAAMYPLTNDGKLNTHLQKGVHRA